MRNHAQLSKSCKDKDNPSHLGVGVVSLFEARHHAHELSLAGDDDVAQRGVELTAAALFAVPDHQIGTIAPGIDGTAGPQRRAFTPVLAAAEKEEVVGSPFEELFPGGQRHGLAPRERFFADEDRGDLGPVGSPHRTQRLGENVRSLLRRTFEAVDQLRDVPVEQGNAGLAGEQREGHDRQGAPSELDLKMIVLCVILFKTMMELSIWKSLMP